MKVKSCIIKVCEKCSEDYVCRKSKISTSRFCSRKCLTSFIAKYRPRTKKNNFIIKKCEQCFKDFNCYPCKSGSRFCSRKCFNIMLVNKKIESLVPKKCEICSEIFQCRKDKINTARFCSRICVGKGGGRQNVINLRDRWRSETEEETLKIKTESFEKFFEKSDKCWEWKGYKKSKLPYGGFTFRGKSYIAHRASYEIYKGKIPKKLIVMHTCDNPPCVNPDHLKVGTYLDNHKDKIHKGRGKVEKLSVDQVKEIKEKLKIAKKRISGTTFIAKEYGVSQSTIDRIKNGKLWGWVEI